MSADLGADQVQRTVETTMRVLAVLMGGLDEMVFDAGVVINGAIVVTRLDKIVVGARAVTDKATVVTHLDKVELCLGRKYFDKGVRLWRGFGLGINQEMELSHGGLQPWVNRG